MGEPQNATTAIMSNNKTNFTLREARVSLERSDVGSSRARSAGSRRVEGVDRREGGDNSLSAESMDMERWVQHVRRAHFVTGGSSGRQTPAEGTAELPTELGQAAAVTRDRNPTLGCHRGSHRAAAQHEENVDPSGEEQPATDLTSDEEDSGTSVISCAFRRSSISWAGAKRPRPEEAQKGEGGEDHPERKRGTHQPSSAPWKDNRRKRQRSDILPVVETLKWEMMGQDTCSVAATISQQLDEVKEVAAKSSSLKGTFVCRLRMASRMTGVVAGEIQQRTAATAGGRTLEEQNVRLAEVHFLVNMCRLFFRY